jgi:hypothetical protein
MIVRASPYPAHSRAAANGNPAKHSAGGRTMSPAAPSIRPSRDWGSAGSTGRAADCGQLVWCPRRWSTLHWVGSCFRSSWSCRGATRPGSGRAAGRHPGLRRATRACSRRRARHDAREPNSVAAWPWTAGWTKRSPPVSQQRGGGVGGGVHGPADRAGAHNGRNHDASRRDATGLARWAGDDSRSPAVGGDGIQRTRKKQAGKEGKARTNSRNNIHHNPKDR